MLLFNATHSERESENSDKIFSREFHLEGISVWISVKSALDAVSKKPKDVISVKMRTWSLKYDTHTYYDVRFQKKGITI